MTHPVPADSTLYQREYSPGFASAFDGLLGWEARARQEQHRLTAILRKYRARRVLDAACGTGFHLALLADQGFELMGSDGAVAMIEKARLNLQQRGLEIPVSVCDWRELWMLDANQFDAILCLGDSFAHLLTADDQMAALRQFHQALAPGGILVLDHRNYDRVIERGFLQETSGGYCCCGDAPPRRLVLDPDGIVTCHYQAGENEAFSFRTFPVRTTELIHGLKEAGFTDVEILVHHLAECDPKSSPEPDFFIEVAVKGQDAPAGED